jgi:hypothetical protein
LQWVQILEKRPNRNAKLSLQDIALFHVTKRDGLHGLYQAPEKTPQLIERRLHRVVFALEAVYLYLRGGHHGLLCDVPVGHNQRVHAPRPGVLPECVEAYHGAGYQRWGLMNPCGHGSSAGAREGGNASPHRGTGVAGGVLGVEDVMES